MFQTLLKVTIASLVISSEALLAQPAKRQTPSPTPLPQRTPVWAEPTSFVGLELGKSLAEQVQVIGPCPTKPVSATSTYTVRDWSYKGFCYETPVVGHKFREVYNGPDIGIGYTMSLVLQDEVVQGAIITIGRVSKDQFLALLRARYGEPHSVKSQTYQNRMGANFTGSAYLWQGPNVSLGFSEYGTSLDEAAFEIVRNAASTSEADKMNQNAQKNKRKL